jgi:aspartate aminotransferase-like enzyme
LLKSGTVFLPGPTEVRPKVLAAMQRQMIPHRGAEMRALVERATRRLQPLFGTRRPVYLLTCAATGTMEAAIRCGTRRRVLALVGGAFGERFARIAEQCGRDVTRVVVEPGGTVTPPMVEAALAGGEYDAVTAVHVETSTGVCTDVAGIGEIVRARDDVLFLVDGVASVGGAAVGMDAWHIDLLFTASQKALALPPGLAFVAASERLLTRARSLPDRGWYLDLVRVDELADRGELPGTPAISLLFALDRQLGLIEREGVNRRLTRHAAMASAVRGWLERTAACGVPVTSLAPPGEWAATVTCVVYPGDAPGVVARMRDAGFLIGGGYGELAAHTFRIGHMGDHTVRGVERMLGVLGQVLGAG